MTGTVIHLPGLVLPPDGPLRDHVRPPARRTKLYLERFDRRTLIYDAVRMPSGEALLTAPRLLNLWPLLRNGLRRGERPVKPTALRRRTALRYEQILVRGDPEGLALELAGKPAPLPLRDSGAPLFDGMRVLMAVNKDNAPGWIADWAHFHARRHGAEGVLLFDNGSESYSPDAIAARLSGIAGIARAVVVSAPFPYGPADKGGRFDVPPRFFQSAMFNLARRDILRQARSVLSVDIDEMVVGPDGQSVFEAAEASSFGVVSLPGRWAFPASTTDGPAPQRAHLWSAEPPEPCHPKWCVVPQSLTGRASWNVHKLGGPLHRLTRSREFSLLHCRASSTGWKPGRFSQPARLRYDDATAELFAEVFENAPQPPKRAPSP